MAYRRDAYRTLDSILTTPTSQALKKFHIFYPHRAPRMIVETGDGIPVSQREAVIKMRDELVDRLIAGMREGVIAGMREGEGESLVTRVNYGDTYYVVAVEGKMRRGRVSEITFAMFPDINESDWAEMIRIIKAES